MLPFIEQLHDKGWQRTHTDLKLPMVGLFLAATAIAVVHGIADGVENHFYWLSIGAMIASLVLAALPDWDSLSIIWRLPMQLLALAFATGVVYFGGHLDHMGLLFAMPLVVAALMMRHLLRALVQALTVIAGLWVSMQVGRTLPVEWLATLIAVALTANWVIDRIIDTVHREVAQARHFRVIGETAQTLMHRTDEGLLDQICQQALQAFGANECVLFLANRERTLLLPRSFSVVAEVRERFTREIGPVPVEHGVTGWVFRNGEPALVGDMKSDPRVRWRPGISPRLVSAMVLPVATDEGQVRGVLRLYKAGRNQFRADDFELARVWATEVGLVLQKAELYSRLEQMAMTDALTGTYNRHYLTQRWPQVVTQSADYGTPVTLLMIDCFDFKQVNDRFGHVVGDELLRELGRTLLDLTPPGGFVVRYGGDEFLMVLPSVTQAEGESLREAIHRRLSMGSVARPDVPPITVAVGVHAAVGGDLNHLLSQVDREMYMERDEASYERMKSLLQSSISERSKHMVQAVMSLTKIQEINDPYTRGHAERAKEIAMRTAVRLRMTPEEVQIVGFGAMLHDVGKVVVPPEILHKPGPLTPEEWRIMRMHPVFGATIVGELAVLRQVKPLILHHHERFDGVTDGKHPGYPAGLKGDEIPLGARIIAVVDAYDAMTTDRVYRKGRPTAEALQELHRMAGTQFDPQVVAAFVAEVCEAEAAEHEARRTLSHADSRPDGSAGRDG